MEGEREKRDRERQRQRDRVLSTVWLVPGLQAFKLTGTFIPVCSPCTLLGLSFLELGSVSCNKSILTKTEDLSVSHGPQGKVEVWGMH